MVWLQSLWQWLYAYGGVAVVCGWVGFGHLGAKAAALVGAYMASKHLFKLVLNEPSVWMMSSIRHTPSVQSN